MMNDTINKCPRCGSENFEAADRMINRKHFFECEDCGLLFRTSFLPKVKPGSMKVTHCPNCKSTVKSKNVVKEETIDGLNKYRCEVCDMEFEFPVQAYAVKKFIRSSPRKMRLVVDLIRGKNVEEAFAILKYSTKRAARDVERLLKSAISNLSNDEDLPRYNTEDLYVKEVFVNQGPTMKRIQPAPMGRAYRVRKRSNHLTIVVAPYEEIEE